MKRIGLLLVLFALASPALADQLVLKNGDRLTGTIVKSDGKTIVFKSDLVGEVTIALDNVENVTADKPLYLTLTDGRVVSGIVTSKVFDNCRAMARIYSARRAATAKLES